MLRLHGLILGRDTLQGKWVVYTVIHCVHSSQKAPCDGRTQRKHLMRVKYSDRPNSKWLSAQHRRKQLQMMWCSVFLQPRLSLSHIRSHRLCFCVLPIPSCHIFLALKKTKNNKALFFSPHPFIITFSFSLSPTNRSVSPYLSTPPSLFLTRTLIRPLIPAYSNALHFILCWPPHHTCTHVDTHLILSLKSGGLAAYLFRPNTYTHPGNQYFFSCCSPHIFRTTQHPSLLCPLLISFSLTSTLQPISESITSLTSCTWSTFLSCSFDSTLLPCSFLSTPPTFLPFIPSLRFFFNLKDSSGSKNWQTVTKRAEFDEDVGKQKRRNEKTEAQWGRATLEGELCQRASVNQYDCVWYLKPWKLGEEMGNMKSQSREMERGESEKEMEKGREGSWHQK